MKKILFLLVGIICFMPVSALTDKQIKMIVPSVFKLTLYDAKGTILATTNGFFVGNNGEALSEWKPFVGAKKAVITDYKGTQYPVKSVIAASDIYNVCKFVVGQTIRPINTYKASPQLSEVPCTVVSMSDNKQIGIKTHIKKSEQFGGSYYYYLLDQTDNLHQKLTGLPVVDEKGVLLGILLYSEVSGTYAITDANYVKSMGLTGMSVNDPLLKQTGIPVKLSDDKNEAMLTLFFAKEQKDSTAYRQYVEEFITKYPKEVEGYAAKADLLLDAGKINEAKNIFQQAIKNVSNADEPYYEYAKRMYFLALNQADSVAQRHNLQEAKDLIQQAFKIKPEPIYKQLQGQILYVEKQYSEALRIFNDLTQSKIKNGDLYYQAAMCKQQLKAPDAEIIQLLDSAVLISKGSLAAPYVLARANYRFDKQEYRKALADYNKYDTLVAGNGAHDFYYIKFKCESQLKQYKQALNDIAHAIFLNTEQPQYYAEMAQLQLRVNQAENALKTINLGLSVDPSFPDAYLIKGLILIQLNKKKEAGEAFNKAKELGDLRAQGFIDKYK